MNHQKSKSLTWEVVEKAISKEINWLRRTIIKTPYRKENEFCDECIYRRIAILIVSGKIKAKDIKSRVCLWGNQNLLPQEGKKHGKEWHSRMMKLISEYFKSSGYDVTIEPKLNMGRADLGIYKENERDLFVEIGTISLYKLLFNLESMEGSDFLLVLSQNRAIEFSVIKAGYKQETTK